MDRDAEMDGKDKGYHVARATENHTRGGPPTARSGSPRAAIGVARERSKISGVSLGM
jgi:hypothetical protein